MELSVGGTGAGQCLRRLDGLAVSSVDGCGHETGVDWHGCVLVNVVARWQVACRSLGLLSVLVIIIFMIKLIH